MSYYSPSSSMSAYNQRYESFQLKMKEQNQNISMRKEALNYSFEIAMKKLQAPKSETKKKVPYVYANSFVLPQTPNVPYIPFNKNLSPAQRFERRWQYRIGKISADDIPAFKYEKIDFATDLQLSDSDKEKENSDNNENEQQKIDNSNSDENKDDKNNDLSNKSQSSNDQESNKQGNIKQESNNQDNVKQESNNQDNIKQESINNNLNDINNSSNSEDLKIEDLDGSNNDLYDEEEEIEKSSSNDINDLITKSEKDDYGEEQKALSFVAEEEEEEIDAELTATQINDMVNTLDNQKGEYEEEEEDIKDILINKKSTSPGLKMSDDANEIFNFSSENSQSAGE